jgi:hypothetical protein
VRSATTAAILAVVLAAVSCSGASARRPAGPPICEIRFAAPDGFAPTESFEQRYDDRIGVRLGFRDVQRRELHVFAGIPGEFGEGLPDAGRIAMTEGRTGVLVGRGDVWFLTWTQGDRCDPRAVLGNGFSRDAFGAALVEAGLAPGAS